MEKLLGTPQKIANVQVFLFVFPVVLKTRENSSYNVIMYKKSFENCNPEDFYRFKN